MSTDDKQAGLWGALLAVQRELPTLKKDATNPHFKNKYISLDSLMAAIRPVLLKHDLLWITKPGADERGEPVLGYELRHAPSGESTGGTMPLLLSKRDPQGLGSALTYSRRHSLTAVLGLVADDDDGGNAAGSATTSSAPLLTPTQRNRVLSAIADTDQDEGLLFAAVGVSSAAELTTDHAKQIRELIDKAVAA